MSGAHRPAMDFRAFVDFSARARRERPDVVPLCETRIERALAPLRPEVSAVDGSSVVHRCDLARHWCELRGVPALAARAFVCEGVRHALGIIFRILAAEGLRVALPRDVYPVYSQLAAQSKLSASTFDTFPGLELDQVFAQSAAEHAPYVLLPFPWKLHGRSWTDAEVQSAQAWLAGDGGRRLILDGVYAFGQRLEPALERLLSTDQVLYLDSLSKGWLHARVFGTAIVPERDRSRYLGAFRSESPSQAKLHAARELLSTHVELPSRLRQELATLRHALRGRLEQRGLQARGGASGYLLCVEGDVHQLLEQHGLLTLPLSAFGGTSPRVCVASALPFVSEP